MELLTLRKTVHVLEQAFAYCAGTFYRINLTRDLVPGKIFQRIDGQTCCVNEKMGLPENARFSDVVSCWGDRLPQEEQEEFFRFLSVENLLEKYRRGTDHVSYRYWTESVLMEPMLVEQHIFMFTDEETADVLAVTYLQDQTREHQEQLYKRKLEKSHARLENQLEESTEKLETEQQYLSVLSRDYVLIYDVDLEADTARLLKMAPYANVGRIGGIRPGMTIPFSEHIKTYSEQFMTADAIRFTRWLDRDYIRRQMEQTSSYSFRCEGLPNRGGNRNFEVQVVRSNPDTFDGRVLISSREIDQVVREEQERQRELEAEREYLDVLTLDFLVVYHVNLDDNTSILIKADQGVSGYDSVKVFLRKLNNYRERMDRYCEKYVVPDLRMDFRRVMDLDNLRRQAKNSSRLVYRYRILQNDHQQQYFEVQMLPMKKEASPGEVLIAFRQIDDLVTEEQRRQIELEEQFERERNQNEVTAALGRHYSAIFQIDLQKDSFQQIVCREQVRHYFPAEEHSASGQFRWLCDEIIAPKYVDRMRRFFDLQTLTQRLRESDFIEEECMVKDGNWHRAQFVVKRRDEQGDAIDVLYSTQVIDEEKHYQEYLLAQVEHANYANEAKTDFISQVSHDIRTPMNAIFGFLDIAQANLDNREKLNYALNKIRVSGGFLKQLTDDVLDITRMESGRMPVRPELTDIGKLLDDVAVTTSNAKFGKKHNFVFDFTGIRHNTVLLDSLRVKQVYSNILSNAIKYTPDDGTISFAVSQQELPEPNKVQLVAYISDNGIGMSDEFMKKMFVKFERATDTRINNTSGFGLGLSITKQLVELMDGTMEVQSKVNVGTTVCIRLNVTYVEQSQQQQQNPRIPYAECCKGMHLLVAEDNELNREVITDLLAMCQVDCVCAKDGRECLELLQQAQPETYDAILMDMQMPNMNGLEATRAIRALATDWTKTIPILAMTANALKNDVEKCLQAGMNNHLSKPINMEQLMKMLWEAVQHRPRQA